MSIQFQKQFLLEDIDDYYTKIVDYLVQYVKIGDQAAKMLADKVVARTPLTHEEAIRIAQAIKRMSEEGSMSTGAGAFNPSLHASKKQYMGPEMKEDAPMLAHGKADIHTLTQDGMKKVKRGESGMQGVIVKDLWEDLTKGEQVIYKGPTAKYGSKILTKGAEGVVKDISGADVTVVFSELGLNVLVNDSNLESLNENYHRFKREALTRTKPQQMHEAAKMIHKKLEEINRLLEYTNQMRGELSEGEEQMEYRHNTKKLFEKINTKVVEAYTKLKKIK